MHEYLWGLRTLQVPVFFVSSCQSASSVINTLNFEWTDFDGHYTRYFACPFVDTMMNRNQKDKLLIDHPPKRLDVWLSWSSLKPTRWTNEMSQTTEHGHLPSFVVHSSQWQRSPAHLIIDVWLRYLVHQFAPCAFYCVLLCIFWPSAHVETLLQHSSRSKCVSIVSTQRNATVYMNTSFHRFQHSRRKVAISLGPKTMFSYFGRSYRPGHAIIKFGCLRIRAS